MKRKYQIKVAYDKYTRSYYPNRYVLFVDGFKGSYAGGDLDFCLKIVKELIGSDK